jgi:cation-transporting ATPase 13A2
MLFDPADWVMSSMELTDMDVSFKVFLLVLGVGNFAVAYLAEGYLLPGLAKWIGVLKVKVGGERWRKQRKQYKIIQESMMI